MTLAPRRPAACLALAAVAVLASPADAQQHDPNAFGPAPAVWRPVDPNVADVSAIGASQRQPNLGLGVFTPEYRMRTRLDPTAPLGQPQGVLDPIDPATGLNLPQPFRYETPGVRARIQRPAYLSITDASRQDITFGGEGTRDKPYVAINKPPLFEPLIVELIPANTVFELTPQAEPVVPPPPGWVDHRVDGRVGTAISWGAAQDGGIDGRVTPTIADRRPMASDLGLPLHEAIDRRVAEPVAEPVAESP
ncbi:MAG: hypothetical protein AAGK09_06375 [Planctomycetota bacterium]